LANRVREWSKGHDPRGFTILELTVVLAIGAALLAFAGWTFSGYVQRSSAQRAAQVFARDLTLARGAAVRARESVVIRFYEGGRWYQLATQITGTEIARRRFNGGGIRVSAIDLAIPGDSVVFSAEGMIDSLEGGATLGEARFSAGTTRYSVFFNGMGASRIEER
jgi:prepilin-type N-terminal cleavage/methylation domain-containing protein